VTARRDAVEKAGGNLPALAGAVEDLKQQLSLLANVEHSWAEYAETLRRILNIVSGRRIEDWLPGVPYELVLEAEAQRGKVSGPLAVLEINFLNRVEFEPFLEPSLRTTAARKLFEAVAEPLDHPQIISLHVLEARLTAAHALLERKKLQLQHDLAVASARLGAVERPPTLTGVAREFWRWFKTTWFGRALWWVGEEHVKALVWAGIGAAVFWFVRAVRALLTR